MSKPRPTLLTYREVAKYLDVHYDTIRAWVAKGDLPVVYISTRCPRIDAADLEAWKAARTRARVPAA